MRSSLIRIASVGAATAFVFACTSGAEKKVEAPATADTTADPAAAAATEAFTIKGADPAWGVEVVPAQHILFDGPKAGAGDTIQFEYKAPNVNGAIREFTVIRMQPDTHRIDITLAMTKCKVAAAEMGWKATVWVDQKQYDGCADKK